MNDDVTILKKILEQEGFVNAPQLAALSRLAQDSKSYVFDARLGMMVIRAHEGRALAPVQDADTVASALSNGGMSIRDVSFSAADDAMIRIAIEKEIGRLSLIAVAQLS
jgi:hypothetical protein